MKTEKEGTVFEAVETVSEPVIQSEPDTAQECVNAVVVPESAKVEKVLRDSVYISMGVGIVPLPLFNVAAVTAGNLLLAKKLAALYGVEFKEGVAKKIIAAVISAGAGTLATPLVESVVGLVPVIGWPLVIGTKPALNGMTTCALGRMFVTHFERGGSFVGSNIDVMKDDFKAAFKNSREWLGEAIKGKNTEAQSA